MEAPLARYERIDVLVNNAGGIFPRRVVTEDNHEMTLQVNHLAPFLLTSLLRERLQATPGARGVTTTSHGHLLGHVDADDLVSTRRRYRSFRTYCTTKLLNVLFTRELSRRLTGGATASCVHPGDALTGFGRDSRIISLLKRWPLGPLVLTSPEAAAPLLALATRPDPDAVNGAYLDRFQPARAARQADDVELARRVWERSAHLVRAGA